jgi:hypothetical protein
MRRYIIATTIMAVFALPTAPPSMAVERCHLVTQTAQIEDSVDSPQ